MPPNQSVQKLLVYLRSFKIDINFTVLANTILVFSNDFVRTYLALAQYLDKPFHFLPIDDTHFSLFIPYTRYVPYDILYFICHRQCFRNIAKPYYITGYTSSKYAIYQMFVFYTDIFHFEIFFNFLSTVPILSNCPFFLTITLNSPPLCLVLSHV